MPFNKKIKTHGLIWFFQDARGMASVEMALILPIMGLFLFGALEASVAHNAGDRVTRAANILADITSKEAQISPDELDDLFVGIEQVIQPIDTLQLEMKITSVIPDNNGAPIVHWSRQNDTSQPEPYPAGEPFSNLENNNVLLGDYSLVVAEVSYKHESGLTGRIVSETLTYDVQRIRSPRRSRRVGLCDRTERGEYENCI